MEAFLSFETSGSTDAMTSLHIPNAPLFPKEYRLLRVSQLRPFVIMLTATSRCKMITEQLWNDTDRGKLKDFEKTICPSATFSTTKPNIYSGPTRGQAAAISAAQNVLLFRDWQRLTSSLRRDRSVLPTDESHSSFCST